jgi:hypothetical protein
MIDQDPFEEISLALDNGAMMTFRGRLFSNKSWFDDEHSVLTYLKLYVTDMNEEVFSIVAVPGGSDRRSRRAYRLSFPQDDVCVIHDGRNEMTLPFDLLQLAVRSLTGLDNILTPEMIEETLSAARCENGIRDKISQQSAGG